MRQLYIFQCVCMRLFCVISDTEERSESWNLRCQWSAGRLLSLPRTLLTFRDLFQVVAKTRGRKNLKEKLLLR